MRRLPWVFGGLNPVPPAYAHLAADFDRENRELLRSIGIPLSLCAGLMYLLVTPLNMVMDPQTGAVVLPLHSLLVLVAWTICWLLYQRIAARAVYLLAILLGLTIAVVSTALVVLTGQASRNTTHLFAIIVICLLPVPPRWMAGFGASSIAVAAIAGVWLASAGQQWLMSNLTVRVVTTTIAFGIIYSYLYRQRWSGFLARRSLADSNSQLTALTDRLGRELALAHEIQQRLLPAAAPACPGLEIAGISRPAQELGGDFYAYAAFADDHLAIAVGDVSGKGLPAALLMATSVALLEATLDRPWAPAALLARLGQALAPHMQATRQNCAVCYADLRAGALTVANAGGMTPLLRQGGSAEWLEVGGFPLGVRLAGLGGYAEARRSLGAGDTLVLSSDGLVEATNAAGELFGFDRVRAALEQAPAAGAQAILDHLLRSVTDFLAGAAPHDDLTIVVVHRAAAEPPSG